MDSVTIFFLLIVGILFITTFPRSAPTPPPPSLDDQLVKTIRKIVIDELNKRLKN
jgi:hypothetical protein